MEEIMSILHPALAPGPFDLGVLLEHEPPITWRPKKEGDAIVGVVIRLLEGQRDTYTFPILELMNAKGQLIRVRASAMTLRNKLEDLNVKLGMVVEIVYKETKISQSSGREYRLFDVKVA